MWKHFVEDEEDPLHIFEVAEKPHGFFRVRVKDRVMDKNWPLCGDHERLPPSAIGHKAWAKFVNFEMPSDAWVSGSSAMQRFCIVLDLSLETNLLSKHRPKDLDVWSHSPVELRAAIVKHLKEHGKTIDYSTDQPDERNIIAQHAVYSEVWTQVFDASISEPGNFHVSTCEVVWNDGWFYLPDMETVYDIITRRGRVDPVVHALVYKTVNPLDHVREVLGKIPADNHMCGALNTMIEHLRRQNLDIVMDPRRNESSIRGVMHYLLGTDSKLVFPERAPSDPSNDLPKEVIARAVEAAKSRKRKRDADNGTDVSLHQYLALFGQ